MPIEKIAFVAPTGKAASVLTKKGLRASTIHKLIYHCDSKKDDKGRVKLICKKKSPETLRKEFDLIILDEASMVPDWILKDLISFNLPILAIGDPGQLPPVEAKSHDLFVKPDYTLTEIVRQAEDNPIIQLATMARNNQYIDFGMYGDNVEVIPMSSLSVEEYNNIMLNTDQIICGTNRSRNDINKYMRNLIGFSGEPKNGDKIICCQNNYDVSLDDKELFPLVNGIIGYVTDFENVNEKDNLGLISFKSDFLSTVTQNVACDTSTLLTPGVDFKYDRHQQIHIMEDEMLYPVLSMKKSNYKKEDDYRKAISTELKHSNHSKKDVQISQFEYAYAISCHKSQGSEFDSVVVLDESWMFRGKAANWLYTAITRAKKKLIIIR